MWGIWKSQHDINYHAEIYSVMARLESGYRYVYEYIIGEHDRILNTVDDAGGKSALCARWRIELE